MKTTPTSAVSFRKLPFLALVSAGCLLAGSAQAQVAFASFKTTVSPGTAAITEATVASYSNWDYESATDALPAFSAEGAAKVSSITPSSGYAGASGGAYFLLDANGQACVISDILLTYAGTYSVGFGVASNINGFNLSELAVSYQIRNSSGVYVHPTTGSTTDYAPLVMPPAPSTGAWTYHTSTGLITVPAGNPDGTYFRIRFNRQVQSKNIYIDDITVKLDEPCPTGNTYKWLGAGSGIGRSTNINDAANWCPTLPATGTTALANANLQMDFTTAGSPELTGNLTVNSLTATLRANNKVAAINTGASALTLNSGLTANITANNPNTNLQLITGSGSVTSTGPVNIANATANGTVSISGNGNPAASIRFNDNVTMGANTVIVANAPRFEFGKPSGTQTLAINSALTLPTVAIIDNATLEIPAGTTITVNGNLNVTAGTLQLPAAGASALTVNGNLNVAAAGTLNAGNSQITLKKDFTNNGSMSSGTSTVILNDNLETQAISGTGTTSFHNLTVNKVNANQLQRSINLNRNVTVSGQLNMVSGILQTGANKITLGSSNMALIESNESYVLGNVEAFRTISTIPQTFGNMGIAITAASGPYTTSVTRTTGLPATTASGSSIGSIFKIDVDNAPSNLEASLIFEFWQHQLNEIPTANLIFFRENPTAPGNWINKGINVNSLVEPTASARGSISLSNIPAFSTWTLGNSASPLPVDLMWFTARRNKDSAVLTWATAMEENNAGFAIEASNDNRSFERIGYVTAGTSTNRGSEYTFTEQQASRHGVRYYRLTQHDLDGTVTVLGVRTVTFDARGTSLATGPNPFAETFTAAIESDKAQTGFVTLTDALGRVVAQKAVQIEKGTNAVAFDGRNLGTGIYILSVQLEAEVLSAKLIKQ